MVKVAVIGECMIELSKHSDNQYTMGFGGDTLNTAVYLTRCGGHADYFTVLGTDLYSQQMITQWQDEGVGTDEVKFNNNKQPGLYIINNDDKGERFFNYWRQNSAARTLFSDYPEVFSTLKNYDLIFLSGISLSLYAEDDLAALFRFLTDYRKAGGLVAFDNNYRQQGWLNASHAQSVFAKMIALTDIALISFDDEIALYGQHSIERCIARYSDVGVNEIIIKNGHHGCHVFKDQKQHFYALTKILAPVDTTAAGDSFNGAYLAAKVKGKSLEKCIRDAQSCAGTVIMHKGAIINRAIALLEDAS
ncbi:MULTISPECIES: sugar kinase [Pseudoalteromonas]|uniref:sugar kinase n=1 Tax=Pseudoalteromonas TaxID=53246 RepID=UPI00036383E4|nr:MULTISPECIES: sugar kinase [Pseudoalteromonas]MCF6146131.1 2-dehydro-3-deoxygluconokinase [Pseudoalteromonas mariniglutinosa NCIMB 1770]